VWKEIVPWQEAIRPRRAKALEKESCSIATAFEQLNYHNSITTEVFRVIFSVQCVGVWYCWARKATVVAGLLCLDGTEYLEDRP